MDKPKHAELWGNNTRVIDGPRQPESQQATFVLILLRGWAPGRTWPLRGGVVLGRDPTCAVAIESDSASRQHAKIVRRADGQWSIVDLRSRNGTRVNGVPVDNQILQEGDRIQLGARCIFKFARQDALEQQLVQTQKMVAVGGLAAGVAHDYNNVLQIIMANASVLLEGEIREQTLSKDERVAFLQGITDAARRAANVTRKLLDFAGKGDDWNPNADLSEAVTGTLKMAEPSLGSEIVIRSDIQQDVAIEGDAGAISQALLNLLVNARDAMDGSGEIRVHLRARELDEDGSLALHPGLYSGTWAELKVTDAGVGIPEELRARVFEPFFTTKTVGEGTGLGLAMVDGIVRRHGGVVVLKSSPGLGTTFRIFLPARIQKAPARRLRRTASADGRRLLIVDDDHAVRRATAALLSRAGYRLLEASGGREAIDLYQTRGSEIDLILLDLSMPGMGGLETLRILRKFDPEVRVVVCSGYSEDKVQDVLREGALGFLPKPYGLAELTEAVRSADNAKPHSPAI